jgi:Cu(I)/Ag(I) efflux system membrane fusion protein
MKFILFFCLLIQSAFSQHNHGELKVTPALSKKEEKRIPIKVPKEQQDRIGLKTSKALKKSITHTIRTVGTVTADERKEAHIHTKLNGWIEKIFANYLGKSVKKGDSLFELYSPELVSTQEEYISANKQGGVGKELAQAALERLKLWGVPSREIKRLKSSKKSSRTMTFESPVDGFIIHKNATQGMYITPGMELYQIADLSRVWIMVTLYEFDVAIVKLGDEVEVEMPYGQSLKLRANINYISPDIETETRTAKARIEVDNMKQSLKPGMYVNVIVRKELGESIVVPDDAIIDTGLRKIVFVRSHEIHFEPREVKIGPRVNGQFIIMSGLKTGEEVVSSAHFYLDAESKLKASMERGSPASKGHGAH